MPVPVVMGSARDLSVNPAPVLPRMGSRFVCEEALMGSSFAKGLSDDRPPALLTAAACGSLVVVAEAATGSFEKGFEE